MKKISFVLLILIMLNYTALKANALDYESLIEVKEGYVIKEDKLSLIKLYGTYSNKGLYAKNIIIKVYDFKTEKLQLIIKPKTNYGYLPRIQLYNFTPEITKQIFLCADSGGSGGFSYSYVYSLSKGKEKILFDYENFLNDAQAKYIDDYKMSVKSGDKAYIVDLTLKGQEYLNEIYNKDKKLIQPVSADVSSVNSVLPFFDQISNRFNLEVLRRITGRYSADSMGYLIDLLRYDQGFNSYYQMLGIT